MITQERIIPRPLSADALAAIGSTAEVCDILRAWGRPDLAARIAWFASDADLDEGDVPLTLESALGFLAFFGTVDSPDGKVDLGCAPEGWICAVWRFPDLRRVSLWFMNSDTVMYAARKSAGHFADLNNGSEVGSRALITERLLETEEWFTWYSDSPAGANWPQRTTSPAIAAPATSEWTGS